MVGVCENNAEDESLVDIEELIKAKSGEITIAILNLQNRKKEWAELVDLRDKFVGENKVKNA